MRGPESMMTTEEAGRRRWKGTTKKERKELTSKAVGSFWAKLSPEERSAEMKRRAGKRKRTKAGANSRKRQT